MNFDLTLSGNSYVDARIYDIQGREVTTLHDGAINASNKKLSWVADNHASGIYFLKVIVDGQHVQFEKIVLLK